MLVALILQILHFIFLFIAFSSPYWYQSWARVYSPFKRLGLWEACFAGLVLEVDPRQRAYHGCWWNLSPEYYEIRAWLMPPWFVLCQVIVTLVFVLSIVNIVITALETVGQCRTNSGICAVQTSTFITFLCAVGMIAVVLIFGIMSHYDHYWMPNPELNFLSWSYGMACLSAFFLVFSLISQCVYTIAIRDRLRNAPKGRPDMGMSFKDSSI